MTRLYPYIKSWKKATAAEESVVSMGKTSDRSSIPKLSALTHAHGSNTKWRYTYTYIHHIYIYTYIHIVMNLRMNEGPWKELKMKKGGVKTMYI